MVTDTISIDQVGVFRLQNLGLEGFKNTEAN